MAFEKNVAATGATDPKPADTPSLQQRVENLEKLLERHGIRQVTEDPAAAADDAGWGKKKNGK